MSVTTGASARRTAPDPTPSTTSPRPPAGRPATVGWVAGGVLVLLLVLAAVAGALRTPTTFDPSTPEGVVQQYVRAMLDGDVVTAHDLLASSTARRCDLADLRNTWVPEDVVVTLDEVRPQDGRTIVTLLIRTVTQPDPFAGDSAYAESFTVVQEDGAWRIAGTPWPAFDC